LQDVGELVCQQVATALLIGLVPARREEEVTPDGEGERPERLRACVCARVGVDPDPAEVRAKPGLHECAGGDREWSAVAPGVGRGSECVRVGSFVAHVGATVVSLVTALKDLAHHTVPDQTTEGVRRDNGTALPATQRGPLDRRGVTGGARRSVLSSCSSHRHRSIPTHRI
jgi:hypothetical protein